MALLQNHRQSSAAAGLGLLESPIETFLGALHSSHALRGFRLWLSLHAAALSLWLRQLFYFATEPVSSRPSHDASPSVCTTFAATDVQVTEPPRPVQASARELASSHVVADLGGEQYYSTQTRFTVHFHDDGLREEDVEVEEEEEEVATVAAPEAADGVFEAVRSLHLPRQGRSSIDIDSSTTGDLREKDGLFLLGSLSFFSNCFLRPNIGILTLKKLLGNLILVSLLESLTVIYLSWISMLHMRNTISNDFHVPESNLQIFPPTSGGYHSPGSEFEDENFWHLYFKVGNTIKHDILSHAMVGVEG
ncbi:hypothetical protein H6P81_015002 [Aristolochia fimbriata]|uniref:Uncharacterized protein n=1 Tax=Aristolochia fimbriata TaxID=158543 RepID=A0AAV7E490_ARIFI|nr:hypothetical protein H6P81_015002 [Aristolochia fimbriata]